MTVDAFGKSLGNIVYLGCNYTMRHVKPHTIVYLLECKTTLELLGNTVVLAIYPYHSHKFLFVDEQAALYLHPKAVHPDCEDKNKLTSANKFHYF